jgi:hypothetical protein
MSLPWWATTARLLLGISFAATALAKLLDIQGFAAVLAQYRLFPGPLLAPLGLGLALAELAVAVGLARPATLRPAAAGAMLLALVGGLLLLVTLARGIDLANCGCFGVYWPRPLRPWTPIEDLALIGLGGAILAGLRR